MATKFIPTKVQDLKRGDLLGIWNVRVSATPLRCDHHGDPNDRPYLFEEEGFDPETGEYDGTHSDVCVPGDTLVVVRKRV